MPVNLNVVVSSGYDFRVKNRNLHHRNEGSYANIKRFIIIPA